MTHHYNSDNYRAVYDAALLAFDISYLREDAQRAIFAVETAAYEHKRPSAVFHPTLSADGDMWCALLGDDLQIGVAGFGKTPAEAMINFDIAFLGQRTPAVRKAMRAEQVQA